MDFTDILTGVFGPVFKGIEAITGSALGKAFEVLVQIVYSWLVSILETIGGWWLDVDPVGASADSGVIHTISDTTRPLAAMLGTIGLIIGFVRVGRSQGSKEDTSMLIEGLMRVAIAGGVAIPCTQLLMGFSSAFAPWVYKIIVSAAHDEATSLMSLLPQNLDNAVVGLAGLSILFIGPLVLFASVIQALMAMGTDIAAGILSALLPITAATSVTAQGNKAFWKQVGWIISCVAFKPAAAIIYGFGVAMAIGGDLSTTDGTSNPVLSMLAGLMVIVLACFSLPSMVALVAPMAGVIGSSGGRFLASAGSAAVGAAVVAAVGVASAGAGAAPATAATGASGASGGAAGGTASGASTATAGTSTASSTGGSAGAESAGGASSELAAGGAQASAEGSGAAGSATAGAGESTGASELGADEASAAGGTPGVDADATGSNLGAGDADAAGADSYSADGVPASDTSAPDSSSAEPAGAQSGASTDAPDTGASASEAAGASAPDTGASAQMPASGADSDTSSSSNASGAAASSSSSTGATSAEASGTSVGSDTSASSGASLSSSYSDGGSSSAPAAANGAPTTTNSTYRPRGGTAAHDAARYLQDMTRAIGDETEGAIRPEGAGQ